MKHQIDLDTLDLNKIEAIRDSHRREAMKEFEEWRLNNEKPMFEGIIGKKQENRKEYRFQEILNTLLNSEKNLQATKNDLFIIIFLLLLNSIFSIN